MKTPDRHLAPTQSTGRRFNGHGPEGEVVMLNLLRLRGVADNSAPAALAPATTIGGAEAFRRDIGGEWQFLDRAGSCLIDTESERRDFVRTVCQRSVQSFLASTRHDACLARSGHRTLAMKDALLCLTVNDLPLEGTA